MGDRQSTLMIGPSIRSDWGDNWTSQMSWRDDLLDRIGGSEITMDLGHSLEKGIAIIKSSIGLHWQSSALNNDAYGVNFEQQRLDRPVYNIASSINPYLKWSLSIQKNNNLLFIFNIKAKKLDPEISASPLVKRQWQLSSFLALSYVLK